MTDEERFYAAAYLQHQAQERGPAYPTSLAKPVDRMETGAKVSLEAVRRAHANLENRG